MDNFTAADFSDLNAYEARMENEVPAYEDCDTWDPIMVSDEDWSETDDFEEDHDFNWPSDYYE